MGKLVDQSTSLGHVFRGRVSEEQIARAEPENALHEVYFERMEVD